MEAPEETEKKQLLPNRLTEDREPEAPTVANRALGLVSIPGAAVAQKDHCHLVGHLRAQSQVKRTKKPTGAQWKRLRKQKEAPYNS